jgi:hypothetical protein
MRQVRPVATNCACRLGSLPQAAYREGREVSRIERSIGLKRATAILQDVRALLLRIDTFLTESRGRDDSGIVLPRRISDKIRKANPDLSRYLDEPTRRAMPDQAKVRRGEKPRVPRCVRCGKIICWGDAYRGPKTDRARGRGLHEACIPAALVLGKKAQK